MKRPAPPPDQVLANMTLPEIDLPKLAGVAGSAVGIIIATAILLSWITGRYVPAFDQYRKLAADLREYGEESTRRNALREQVGDYRRRLRYLNRASALLCWVMVLAVVTVLISSLSLIYPRQQEVAIAGAACLFVALMMDLGAVACVLVENGIDRHSIEAEARDLDEADAAGAKPAPAPRA